MTERIYVGVRRGCNEHFWEDLEQVWGENFDNSLKRMKEHIAWCLRNFPEQLGTVFRREGLINSHLTKVGIQISLNAHMKIRLHFTVSPGESRPFFSMGTRVTLEYCPLDGKFKASEVHVAMRRIVGDFARDGLPVEMKRAVVHLAKVFQHFGPLPADEDQQLLPVCSPPS